MRRVTWHACVSSARLETDARKLQGGRRWPRLAASNGVVFVLLVALLGCGGSRHEGGPTRVRAGAHKRFPPGALKSGDLVICGNKARAVVPPVGRVVGSAGIRITVGADRIVDVRCAPQVGNL